VCAYGARPPVVHARVSKHVSPSPFACPTPALVHLRSSSCACRHLRLSSSALVLLRSRLGDSEEDLQEAQDALEEMVEEEEEEAELEEVGAVKGNPCTADGCLL
jgi:hypothetical protein